MNIILPVYPPDHAQYRNYLWAILDLYIDNEVKDLGWSPTESKYLTLIPGITPAEQALVDKLVTTGLVPLATPTDYLRAFVHLHEQGIDPISSKAIKAAEGYLEGILTQYITHLSQQPIKATFNDTEIRVPVDRATRAALSELVTHGEGSYNWHLDAKFNPNIPAILLDTAQLTVLLKGVLAAWEGPDGIWAQVAKLRGEIGGEWVQALPLIVKILKDLGVI